MTSSHGWNIAEAVGATALGSDWLALLGVGDCAVNAHFLLCFPPAWGWVPNLAAALGWLYVELKSRTERFVLIRFSSAAPVGVGSGGPGVAVEAAPPKGLEYPPPPKRNAPKPAASAADPVEPAGPVLAPPLKGAGWAVDGEDVQRWRSRATWQLWEHRASCWLYGRPPQAITASTRSATSAVRTWPVPSASSLTGA